VISKIGLSAAALGVLFGMSGPGNAAPCNAPNSIAKIKNTSIGMYEYVVFDFIRPPTLPNYSVSTHSGTFIQDASGNTVTVTGSHFKQVQFRGVVWTCSIQEVLTLPRTAIKGIKNVGQFEGVITYGVGYRAGSLYMGTYNFNGGGGSKKLCSDSGNSAAAPGNFHSAPSRPKAARGAAAARCRRRSPKTAPWRRPR
jgi:hypothetical protein